MTKQLSKHVYFGLDEEELLKRTTEYVSTHPHNFSSLTKSLLRKFLDGEDNKDEIRQVIREEIQAALADLNLQPGEQDAVINELAEDALNRIKKGLK